MAGYRCLLMAAGQARSGLITVEVIARYAVFFDRNRDSQSNGYRELAVISFLFPGRRVASLINVDSEMNACCRKQ